MRHNKLLLLALGAWALGTVSATGAIVDGVRQKPVPQTTSFAAGTEAYLYNAGAKAFFGQGNDYGTRASISEDGRLVRFDVEDASDGVYTMWLDNDDSSWMGAGWHGVFIETPTAMWVDHNQSGAVYFEVVPGNGNEFRIQASGWNDDLNKYNYPGCYVGLESLPGSNRTDLWPFLEPGTYHHIDWAMVTPAAYAAYEQQIALYNQAQLLYNYIAQLKTVGTDVSSLESVYLNEAATASQLTEAIGVAIEKFVGYAENHTDVNIDVTFMINNPNFEKSGLHERQTAGWQVDAYPDGNVRTGGTTANMTYEAWNSEGFDLYQMVPSAPLGVYQVEVQGFYRYLGGFGREVWNAYYDAKLAGNKLEVPVYVYMNNNATPLMNIFDQPVPQGEMYLTDTSLLDTPNPPYEDPFGYWYPYDMNNVAIAFANGLYKMSAYGLVAHTGDELRLGVKGVTSQNGNSWAIWDNFRLVYRGFSPEVIQPVLELAISECDSLKNYLMGKTEYAQLTKAFADASQGIENQDGYVMLNALNDLYDAKDAALESLDIFYTAEVRSDTLRLADALRKVETQRLSKATFNEAKALLAGIVGNTIYENSEIEQLKRDVSNAIDRLDWSVTLYAMMLNANTELSTVTAKAKEQGVAQALIAEAQALHNTTHEAYLNGSLTDTETDIRIDELYEMIYRLNEAIQVAVSIDGVDAAKASAKPAYNLRGQAVDGQTQRGIVIREGKKSVVTKP